MSKDENPSASYFNLTVDYIEKFYASGKILGSRFTRREGKPGDEAVLAGTIKELDNRVWDAEALEDEKISSFPVSLMLWRKDMSSFASPLLVLVDVSLRASKYPVVTAWWI